MRLSVIPPRADTTIIKHSSFFKDLKIILMTFLMFSALATDEPPNFSIFIDVDKLKYVKTGLLAEVGCVFDLK